MFKSLIYWFSVPSAESVPQNLKSHQEESVSLENDSNNTDSKLGVEEHQIAKVLVLEFINQLNETVDRPRVKNLKSYKVSNSTMRNYKWQKVLKKNLEVLIFYLGSNIISNCIEDGRKVNHVKFLENIVDKTGHHLVRGKTMHHHMRTAWTHEYYTIK